MKKFKIALLVSSLSLLSVNCFALDGGVLLSFKGLISTKTCNVDVDGVASSPVVTLPSIPSTDLPNVGSTAGAKEFRINLTNCNIYVTRARSTLIGNRVTTSGNLGSIGTAKNVSIQVANAWNSSVIDFSQQQEIISLPTELGKAYIPFIAKYYAEGTVTGGTVIATAQYALIYE